MSSLSGGGGGGGGGQQQPLMFIPAKTWEGSKPGYYFGTTKENGTGYHWDTYQQKKNKILQQANKHQLSQVERPSAKRAKRGVVFAEEKNEIRTYIPANNNNNNDRAGKVLLEQAEEAAKDTKVLDLSLKGVQIGIKNLIKAQEKNQMIRSEHPDDPTQYMESELALYEAITALQPIASEPATLYQPFLLVLGRTKKKKRDSEEDEEQRLALWTTTFSQLCMHDNTDVVSTTVALLLELLDPSLLVAENFNTNPTNRSILLLGQAILEYLMELLVSNLSRLQQQQQSSSTTSTGGESGGIGKGVEDILSLIENLLEIDLMVQNNADDNSDDDDDEMMISLVPPSSKAKTSGKGGGGGGGTSTKSSGSSVAGKLVQDTTFLSWLFEQIDDDDDNSNKDKDETTTPSGSNPINYKDRCLELLAFLVQREEVHKIYPDWTKLPPYKSVFDDDDDGDDDDQKKKKKKDEKKKVIDGMEILLLHGIAPYRKKQPSNEQQVEALENACIAIEAATTFSPTNLETFLDKQGIELVLRCVKERVHAGGVALKLLDFSGGSGGNNGSQQQQQHPVYKKACEHLVAEAGGLKHLFPLFMGRQIPKPAILTWSNNNNNNNNNSNDKKKKKPNSAIVKAKREWLQNLENQIIRILYALTRHLTDESPNDAKQRLLVKFLDEDKSDRLVELCLGYDQKARMAEFKFWKSGIEDEMEDETGGGRLGEEAIQLAALEAKLRGGGDIFHRLGAIAGFCCVGSKRCHERILSQLTLQKSGIAVVKAALEEFLTVLGPGHPQTDQLRQYFDGI